MVPFVLLLAALVLAPVIGGGYGELTNGILQILVFAAACAYALLGRREERAWYCAPGAIALVVLVLVSLLSLAFSDSIYLSLKQSLFGFACIGAYFLASSLARDNKAAATLVCGVALSGLLISVTDIRDYALMTGGGAEFWAAVLGPGEKARRHGGFVSPNHFAAFLVTALPVTLALYAAVRRRAIALVFGLAFAVQIASLGMTGSKAGALAAMVALMVYLLLAVFSRSFDKQSFVRLLVIVLLISPIVIVFTENVKTRVEASKIGGAQSHSEKHRIYTWRGTLNIIEANPWTGVGPGAFEIAFPRYAIAGHTTHAHQSYLQLAAENGVVALGALLIGLGAVGIAGLKGVFSKPENEDTSTEVSDRLTWEDVLPERTWPMLSCGLVGAFAGSMITNLADSGWYVMGVALPFCIMAGVMAGRAGSAKRDLRFGAKPRLVLVSVCAVGAILSLSFGLADMVAPQGMNSGDAATVQELQESYRLASTISPLNPLYHRELAKLSVDNPSEALAHVDRAIKLAPSDAQNYYVRGIVAREAGRLELALGAFDLALKLKPHSTQILYDLAITYSNMGRTSDFEATLRRLLALENTDYERVTGVPEMVDTRYARAHYYFGHKNLAAKQYDEAANEFRAAVERMERWRSYPLYIQVARVSGQLTASQESELLGVLRDSYYGLSEAYAAVGKVDLALEAQVKASQVPDSIPADGDSS